MSDVDGTPVNVKGQGEIVNDALINLAAEMGTNVDKRSFTSFTSRNRHTREELEAMYRFDWLSGKLVDIVPDDMTRQGRTLNSEMDSKRLEDFKRAEIEFGVAPKVHEALKWARLYGGALIYLGVNDGLDPSEPLDISNIKKGTLSHLTVLDRHYAPAMKINTWDVTAPNFGMPDIYSIVESTHASVHWTRIVRFDGIKLPLRELKRNQYWGDSILERMYEALIDAGTVSASSSTLLLEQSVDVMKVPNLLALASTPAGEEQLRKRFQLAKLMKSLNNILLMDDTEGYETHHQPFNGIPQLFDRFYNIVASASDIPVTRLMGSSPGGLNATGESDIRNYYDMISSRQENQLRPSQTVLDRVIAQHLWGEVPEDFTYEYDPLWQQTEDEQATTEKSRSERDKTYLEMGVVTEDVVAQNLIEQGTYTSLTKETIEELDNAEEEARKLEEEEQARKLEPTTPAAPGVTEPSESDEPDGDVPPADTAMNGAQVTSLVEVVKDIQNGAIPYDSGVAILMTGFMLSEDDAKKIAGDPSAVKAPAPTPTPPVAPVPPFKKPEPSEPKE